MILGKLPVNHRASFPVWAGLIHFTFAFYKKTPRIMCTFKKILKGFQEDNLSLTARESGLLSSMCLVPFEKL